MKIAFLGENYFPTLGGIQEHIYHLARDMMGRGHEVRVLTGLPQVDAWRGPRDEPWVRRVGRARSYSVMGSRTTFTFGPAVAWRLRRALRQEQFDLVHVHAPCDMGLPLLLYPLYRGPVVATLHSPMNDPSLLRWLAAPYYRFVLRRCCDAVIAVSDAARTAMGRYAEFESRLVPNGVDGAALARGKPLPRFLDGLTNILMMGRLEPRNGPDILIQALPRILERRPDVRLLVAGAGKDGTADYQAMVPSAVRDRVVFLGAVYDERPDIYASASLCVVPARSGSFSIIVLEALAAGVPVVATPFVAGWQRERHWKPVRVSPDFSPESLAETVLQALADDPSARIAQGRELVRGFDWKEIGRRVEMVYHDVLAARARYAKAVGSPRAQRRSRQSS
jgi:phosphatidylinositol alpha-mannosyltransferase